MLMQNNGTNLVWYRQPARTWNEALPLGNGRLGAMVYGGVTSERIALNEDTLWSGHPGFYANPDAPASFKKARDMALQGNNAGAEKEIEDHFEGLWSQAYMPLGDICISMEHGGEYTDYRRELDLSTGVHAVTYTADGVTYTREMFVSHPDQALVMRLTANRAGALNFIVSLLPSMDGTVCMTDTACTISGNCPTYVWHYGLPQQPRGIIVYGDTDETKGMAYYACCRIVHTGGKTERRNGGIRVSGADCVTLLFDARTSFNGWNKHPVLEGKDPVAPCLASLDGAERQSYESLLSRHIADHKALYDRVELDLGGGQEKYLPTDERLYRHEDGLSDLALYALYFNFGRYLTIAASREGTQPTNLQGIWCDMVTPPWNCNYTININTQMNYWPTLMIDLPECYEPLTRMVTELCESGQRTAREYYGVTGFASHHNTDIWRLSTPVGARTRGSSSFAFWPMSAGWLTRHMWERYEYTRDEAYLRDTAWPVIRSAAEFLKNVLSEDENGCLMVAPSTSPENRYLHGDGTLAVSATTAMTQAITLDVFTILTDAAKALHVGDDELVGQVSGLIPRLRPFGIGSEGELLEWDQNFPESDIHHRHISHLYGLHPGRAITLEGTPELAQACRVSLERRGDESTGWAMGWRINQWARLRDGDHALKLIDNQLRTVEGHRTDARGGEMNYSNGGGTYLNLFDAHPPFQIDGNYGAVSGIAEMLLQVTDDGQLLPLPALPTSWRQGHVKGLRARNGQKVNIYWHDGNVRVETEEN